MEKLQILFNQHPDAINSHSELAAYLYELFPNSRAETNALLAAYDLDIIKQAKEGRKDFVISRYIGRLEDYYGISRYYAEFAANTWCSLVEKSVV